MNQLYKFYNRNASSIRGIMIANCPWLEDGNDQTEDAQMAANDSNEPTPSTSAEDVKRAGNPLSQPKMIQAPSSSAAASSSADTISLQHNRSLDNSRSIHYLAEFREEFEDNREADNSIEDSDFEDDSQGLFEFHSFSE